MRSVTTIAALIFAVAAANANAQSDREGTWEIGFQLLDLSSLSVQGLGGSSADIDDETGWGFTGAYNFTNRFAAGLDISWSDPAYVATLVPDGPGLPQTVNASLDLNVIHFKAIINLLDGNFTPYLEAGGGWTYVDSNIVEGISGPVCWWDPWWGYVCTNYYDTYTDTRTSIAGAVGIRWDLESDLVFKASWGVIDVDTDRSDDVELDSIQLSFSWRF